MSHTDSKIVSYFRLVVWWLGQRLPMEGIFWTSLLTALLLLIAWGVVPLYLWHLDKDADIASLLNLVYLTKSRWMGICWVITGAFSLTSILLICRLLCLQYKSYYDKYSIPGIRW